MKVLRLAVALFSIALLSGCRAIYTSVESKGGDRFVLTRVVEAEGQLVEGTYDPVSRTLTLTKIVD